MATADLLTRPVVRSCPHEPACPAFDAVDREAARAVASHPEQGWTLLCNGVISFDDTGELLPDGRPVAPHRGFAPHVPAAPEGEASHA